MIPEFYGPTDRIDPDLFTVREEADRTLYIYNGPEGIALHKVLVNTQPVKSLVGKILFPGAAVAIMRAGNHVGAQPGKVQATGNVMRNGVVVRDVTTPETDAADAAFNATWAADTASGLLAMVQAEATPEALEAYLRGRSYSDDALREELISQAQADATSGT